MKRIFLALALFGVANIAVAAGQGGGQGGGGGAPTHQAAAPAEGYWQYGSWQVRSEVRDSVEDGRYSNCAMWTGGDGDPTVTVDISSQDVGPPTAYPSVVVEESAPRGYPTYMKEGQNAYVRFDDEDSYDGEIVSYYDEDNILNADMPFHAPVSQWVLQAMRRNGQMDVVIDHKVFFVAYLDGFTASYLKMMEQCGFDGTGVVK